MEITRRKFITLNLMLFYAIDNLKREETGSFRVEREGENCSTIKMVSSRLKYTAIVEMEEKAAKKKRKKDGCFA